MQRDYCRDMRDHWKHSFIRIRKRFLAAGAGAVLLAGTILPPVTAVSAGLQDVRSDTTEAVTGQAGGQADAGTSGASSAQTDPAAITDGNSAQSSDAGLPDGIDISGSSSGDGSTSESSALQQGSGQESGSLQQGSSADPGTGTAGSENVPSGGIQNGAAPSEEEGTETGIRELLVFPEDLPIVFEQDAELVTDEEKEPLIGKTDDGVYVLSGEKIQFRLDEAEAQKEWHARRGNDPKVQDRRYMKFDETKQQVEVLTSLLESVSCTYDRKTGIYTFIMPQQTVSIRVIEKRADGVIVVPGNAGSVISDDAQGQASTGSPESIPDGITDEESESASETAPLEQDGIEILPESETGAEDGSGEVRTDDETESPAVSGEEAGTEADSLKGLSFKSSDEKVAIVGNDGQITGVAPGTAIISVYKDGKLKSQTKVTIR